MCDRVNDCVNVQRDCHRPGRPSMDCFEPARLLSCQKCGDIKAEKRRQLTAYANDKLNFAVLCDECQGETNEYWQEQWDDYYGGLL